MPIPMRLVGGRAFIVEGILWNIVEIKAAQILVEVARIHVSEDLKEQGFYIMYSIVKLAGNLSDNIEIRAIENRIYNS